MCLFLDIMPPNTRWSHRDVRIHSTEAPSWQHLYVDVAHLIEVLCDLTELCEFPYNLSNEENPALLSIILVVL